MPGLSSLLSSQLEASHHSPSSPPTLPLDPEPSDVDLRPRNAPKPSNPSPYPLYTPSPSNFGSLPLLLFFRAASSTSTPRGPDWSPPKPIWARLPLAGAQAPLPLVPEPGRSGSARSGLDLLPFASPDPMPPRRTLPRRRRSRSTCCCRPVSVSSLFLTSSPLCRSPPPLQLHDVFVPVRRRHREWRDLTGIRRIRPIPDSSGHPSPTAGSHRLPRRRPRLCASGG